VHALGSCGHTAVDVSGPDHDRRLDPRGVYVDDLLRNRIDRRAVDAVVTGTHQRLAGQLQQDATKDRARVSRCCDHLFGLNGHQPVSSKRSNSSTSAPSSARAWPTFFEESWIHSWSLRTSAPKNRLFSIPSTIFSRACSGFDCTSSELA